GRYYGNAAATLGLARPVRGGFEANADTFRFITLDGATRRSVIASNLGQIPVFREALAYTERVGTLPSFGRVERWLADHTALNATTRARRARTVHAWMTALLRGHVFGLA